MDAADYLATVAQIAVSIAGFSGIVVAIAQRGTAALAAIERVRLIGLVADSVLVLFLVLFSMVLLSAAIAPAVIWSLCSTVYAGIALASMGLRIWHSRRIAATGANRAMVAVVLPLFAASVALQAWNAFAGQAFWPFAVTLAFHVAIALALFCSLLFGIRSADR